MGFLLLQPEKIKTLTRKVPFSVLVELVMKTEPMGGINPFVSWDLYWKGKAQGWKK